MRGRKRPCRGAQDVEERRAADGGACKGNTVPRDSMVPREREDAVFSCAQSQSDGLGNVQQRRDHFMAAARDCCLHWWISSAPELGADETALSSATRSEGRHGEGDARGHSWSDWQREPSLRHLRRFDDMTCSNEEPSARRDAPCHRSCPGQFVAGGDHYAVSPAVAAQAVQSEGQESGLASQVDTMAVSSSARWLKAAAGFTPQGKFVSPSPPDQSWSASGRVRWCQDVHCSSWSPRTRSSSVSHWGRPALFLIAVLQFALWQPAGSWIALSKDGYTIKHNLIAEAGIKVTGDLRVNGVLMSKPVENILCTQERAGSMRWNDKFFESCDGVQDWQPVHFCDRSCNVNAHAVPCGVAVLNKCGNECNQVGTGLNMRQCLLKTATTSCNVEVRDNCGNRCGILGQFDCDSTEVAYGGVMIKSLDDAPSTAGYEFTVGADLSSENRDSLFLTYKNMGGIEQALTMIRRLADHDSGMEFAKPPGQPEATMRVSMFTELTGELIQLGKSTQESQLFVDGVLDKECPFVFNGGVNDGNVTKLCLETPTQQRTLTLPDASGTVITSGNREDITNLPGLQGDNTFVYTGSYRDLRDIVVPRKPRVSCDAFSCDTANISTSDGSIVRRCTEFDDLGNRLNYANRIFDIFRVYYLLDEGRDIATGTLPEDLKQKISFDTTTIAASSQIRQILREFWQPYENHTAYERPRMELLLHFLRMMIEEAGIVTSGALQNDVDELIKIFAAKHSFGDVSDMEGCFVCCGSASSIGEGLVPARRSRPKFCVGGEKDGSICQPFRDDCPAGGSCNCPGGGACVDDPAMSCFEHDFGIKCFDLTSRPNFTSTVNFTEPTAQRQLLVPDASGTFITTGNLEDITSVGVLTSSIVAQSSNTTTTTLQFERCMGDQDGEGNCGMKQVSSVLKNNTLLMPSAADGILLTTGNLEDVTLDSSAMTGLSVTTDVHINGLLRFGDPTASGIRLPPRVSSQHYAHPHGNQHPGNVNPADQGGPGQLSFLLEKDGQGGTTRVFEFEPRDPSDERDTAYLTVPARNGTVISTGNLESVTTEAGSMTSLSVGGSSYLEGGLTLGNKAQYGKPTLAFQGSVKETIVHRNPMNINETHWQLFGEAHPDDAWSTTKVGFHMQPQTRAQLEFPATSGTIITTGNLEDISKFEGQLLNVSGTSHLRGPVRLGSNRSTAIKFSGFLEGDIVSRTAPRFRDRGTQVEHVPAPNSWGRRDYAFCENGVPAVARDDSPRARTSVFPTWERYPGTWAAGFEQTIGEMSFEYYAERDAGKMIFATAATCRSKCKEDDSCGIVVRSRYLRGSIRVVTSTSNGPTADYVTATPRSNDPGCLTAIPSLAELSTGSLEGAAWAEAVTCQRAAVLDVSSADFKANWGSQHMALADIDVVVARCKNQNGGDWMPCWDMEMCSGVGSSSKWHTKTCEVSFRQHFTGAYLGTESGPRCYRPGPKPPSFDDANSVCTGWRSEPSLWEFEPATKNGFHYLSRVGVCAEVEAPLSPEVASSARLTCDWSDGEADVAAVSRLDIEILEWGMGVGGVCGSYNTSVQSCVRADDQTRWEEAKTRMCVSYEMNGQTVYAPGCYINMNEDGMVEIVRSAANGLPMVEPFAAVQDTLNSARFLPAASCLVSKTRLVVQGRCKARRYMADLGGGLLGSFTSTSIVKGTLQLSTLHSITGPPMPSGVNALNFECWLTYTPGPNCFLQTHMSWDVDFYMRDEATRLTFAAPSDSQTQWFPDADGTIITSGNVEQISHLRGLEGANNFIFSSGDQPGDPTTIIDFAALGTAPASRRKGVLPQYSTPDGELAHADPENGVRLVFPDATGTVITTGNTDDLVFKSINLEGLEIQLEANFGEPGSQEPTILNFGASSRISGCFNFVKTEGDTAYTQMCAVPPTRNNVIELPDVSGIVLTTGNLLGLPAIAIPDEHMFVGGDVSLEGSIELGHPDNITTLEMFTWIDGDVGLTLQSAGGTLDKAGGRQISKNVVDLTVPHMSGLDRAMRAYLSHDVKDLPVDVQHRVAYRAPVPGTSRVNQSLCSSLLSSLNVGNYHALGYYLTAHKVLVPTLLRGRPYAALLDVNGTEHYLPDEGAGPVVCKGEEGPDDCSLERFACGNNTSPRFMEEGGTSESGQRNRATAVGHGRPGGYLAEGDSRCAFDGDISTNFESWFVSAIPSSHKPPGGNLTGRCVLGMTMSKPRALSRFRIYVRAGFGANVVGARLQAFRPHRGSGGRSSGSNGTSGNQTSASYGSPAKSNRLIFNVSNSTNLTADNSTTFTADGESPASADESPFTGASNDDDGVWEELFIFERPVREGEWNDVDLATLIRAAAAAKTSDAPTRTRRYAEQPAGEHTPAAADFLAAWTKVRYVGPACGNGGVRDDVPCRCDVAEMEWHHGGISQQMSPLELGTRSYFVQQTSIMTKPEVAMVLKCAQQRWYPNYLSPDHQELALPEASGTLLTTGNLRDITIEAGAMSSVGVKGDVYIAGDTVFGEQDSDSYLEIHSIVEGRFPLSLAESSDPAASVTLNLPDPTGDSYIHLPDASGTIVTTGSLPAVMDDMVVVGSATLEGKVRMEGDVVIGDKLKPGILEVHSPLASTFPLTFAGASPADQLLALSVETPTTERVLVLPDVSGTVLTTGNMPNVLESTSFTGESIFHGGASFLDEDVVLGTRDAGAANKGGATLELNAVLQGSSPLHFEGLSADNRTLSILVEEPSGRNTITLPDVSGTIITTGNFPDVVERLRILGDATFEGHSSLTGQHVKFGRQDRSGKLEVNARITGRFPLSFSDADEHGRGGSTTLEITPPTGNNIITFPDSTGTVITSGNLPSSVILPEDDYTIQCESFVASAPSVAMGVSAAPPKHKGSFVFTDGYTSRNASKDGHGSTGAGGQGGNSPPFTSRAENSFNVRATGGVKFVTGYTPKGRELGVVLSSGSSAWSVLSDRDSKEDIQPVDTKRVLQTLVHNVPISTWSYEGDSVRHMGPMAQDFFDAFQLGGSRRHISSVDADGVAMAALQGLHTVHKEAQERVEGLRADAEELAKEVEQNERMLAMQERQIAEAESALALMMSMLGGQGVVEG